MKNESAYLRRQMAYTNSLKNDHDGTWAEIGFEPADCVRDSVELKRKEHCHTKYFRFSGTQGIDTPRRGVNMILMDSLYGCPAGSSWEGLLVANIEDINDIAGPHRKNLCREIRSPKNESCTLLTPHIHELNTCKSDIWNAELQAYRAQMLSDHRDSVNRYKEFYKDSVRKQRTADSILAYAKYETCISNGGDSASCMFRYGLSYISWSSFNIDKYDFHTPLNVWKTLDLNRKERGKGK